MSVISKGRRRTTTATAPVELPARHPAAIRDTIATSTVHRAVALLAALSLFGVCFATWSTVVQVPVTGAISVAGFAACLALVLAVFLVRPEQLGRVDLTLMLVGLALLAGWAISNIYLQPGYGTDEAAFEQYAASLLLHGHNPYGANLAPALTQFRVPIQYATYLLGGGFVHTLGYPALPVLVTAAFVPVTGGVQAAIVANVLALAATCVVTYLLLPRPWKSVGVLVTIGVPILFGESIAGVNAVLMGLPLMVAAWRWTDTGRRGTLGRSGTARAICLGLAISTQPLAWFVTPFVLVGIWRLRQAELGAAGAGRVVLRYGGIAAATFAAINLPFVIWSPGAWLTAVTSTLTQHAIPYGQGLVDATLFFHMGGGNLAVFTLAGFLAYVAALAAFTLRFDLLGRACFVLPVIALFLTTRSLAEYFMAMVDVWAVSLLTTRAAAFRMVPSLLRLRRPGLALTALFVPAAAAAAVALMLPSPLRLDILSVRTTGELQSVWELKVAVTNTSGHAMSPQFEANYIGQATTFFHRLAGPASLAPGRRAVYTLAAPNRGSMPGITSAFTLVATTAHPETISISPRYIPHPYSADLEPGYVNGIVPRHGATTFRVYLRSPFGAVVHKAGVRIALGQLIYGQTALIDAQASINGRPEGQTPVSAVTDSRGIATFRITDPQPQDQPIYFQAWIDGAYPFGYSAIVPVLWQR
ncbi:MAG TPA: hypothetical protein VH063_04290 [Gaiellaceae bacterium]|jgi:uncharacterized membrane protein|nr:hypothetical protein [Gaiellaceae bacterium]